MLKMKSATYGDMKAIPVIENGEMFAPVDFFDKTIMFGHDGYTCSTGDMKQYFDGKIIVREGVAKRLANANKKLKKRNPKLRLFVNYGYRVLDIQKRRFDEEMTKCDLSLSYDKRIEITHAKIASPDVAGHPTGGAVDLTLFNEEKNYFLDMGCLVADFSGTKYFTYAKGLTKEQVHNRFLLDEVMTAAGFCHYYGEWWHFCYGDLEWAFFFNKQHAIYEQKDIREIALVKL
jgi:D-alanyl-D-alanine dipeptidase